MTRARFMAPLALAIASTLACAGSSRAGVPMTDYSVRVDIRRFAALQANDGTSTSIAVVKDGRVIALQTYGCADLSSRHRASVATRYAIGSITKQFTAVAVMQLVERGRVRLDDRLARFVPEFVRAHDVTIEELLRHRSGIPDYFSGSIDALGRVHDPRLMRPISSARLARFESGRRFWFAPGSDYAYSNTDYVLLGRVVERVTGMSLHAYLRLNVFRPAKLRETTFIQGAHSGDIAVGYDHLTGGQAEVIDPSWYFAVGDVLSTPRDLASFDAALMDGTLVSKRSFRSMLPTIDGPSAVGFGFFRTPYGDEVVDGHHGGIPGFEGDNEIVPAHRIAIVVLTNAFDDDTDVALNRVLHSLFPTALTNAKAASGEDPRVRARLIAYLSGFQRGVVDRRALSARYRRQLTPTMLATLRRSYGPLGPARSAIFRGFQREGADMVYYYDVRFSDETLQFGFALDGRGLIDGV